MSRADHIRQTLLWEQVAKSARDRAAQHRQALADEAHAEVEQGTVPSWRLPDLATVTLPLSQEAPIVADAQALADWVATRHPTEVVPAVRPAFLAALLPRLECAGDVVVDPETGEVIPGLGVRPGGVPGSLTIRPTAGARRALAEEIGAVVDALAAALDEASGAEPGGE